MGYIDTHSEYSLYDVLEGSLGFEHGDRDYMEPEGSVDFYGFHVHPATDNGKYTVQYDGHVGQIDIFDADEFDDVLELVDYLMSFVFRAQEYDYQDDKEELVEWAGKIVTHDEDRADEQPEIYMHVPDDV